MTGPRPAVAVSPAPAARVVARRPREKAPAQRRASTRRNAPPPSESRVAVLTVLAGAGAAGLSVPGLVDVVAARQGVSAIQHAMAVRNALQRLRHVGHVENPKRGQWVITAQGRAAAGAAKEAP